MNKVALREIVRVNRAAIKQIAQITIDSMKAEPLFEQYLKQKFVQTRSGIIYFLLGMATAFFLSFPLSIIGSLYVSGIFLAATIIFFLVTYKKAREYESL